MARLVRSRKLQNESFPNFLNFRPGFCPEFCSEFSPNFLRSFRASFRGRQRPEKIHQKSPPFFNAKFPGKHEKNIHKILLESRHGNDWLQRLSGAPEGDQSAIGKREICDRDRLAISHQNQQVFLQELLLLSGVVPANQTKERSVHEHFAGANLNQNSI